MESEKKKRPLGYYSWFMYPIWFLVLIAVTLHYEFARQANWEVAFGANGGSSVPMEQVVAGHNQIMVHFLISFAILILIPFVWGYFVSREKKKYPERYRKY